MLHGLLIVVSPLFACAHFCVDRTGGCHDLSGPAHARGIHGRLNLS